MEFSKRFAQLKCCVIIPTYNNEKTLKGVIDDVLEYTGDVIVVNDGATDRTSEILNNYSGRFDLVCHDKNLGKGMALRNGFKHALEKGYRYAITIDSDGQHFASDLPSFLDEIEKEPECLLIGARNMNQEHVPGKSSFGNKFSNFWFKVETGISLEDTQSGFRLYPIYQLKDLKYLTRKFEFEVEVIVKAAWKGVKVKNIPIKVHYEAERVTHFRPFKDFTRISILNTWLVTLALLYYIPRRFIKSLTKKNINHFIKKNFFDKNESLHRKALSIGFGVFMGIFPIWGYQIIVGLAVAHFLKLNKALVVVASHISIPPAIPLIIYASYYTGSFLVKNPQNDIFFVQGFSYENVSGNLLQYITGAVALSLIAGALSALLVYFALSFKRNISKSGSKVV
ncbi:DUF2062 domain-containing protein [Cytophagaceae bacterium ABcell3]|nr:DUF2062 domain-containing protein [Cytophagaceae bacterium ABcell3]